MKLKWCHTSEFARKITVAILTLCALGLLVVHANLYIIVATNDNSGDPIGIIDGKVSLKHSGTVFNDSTRNPANEHTHGDSLVEFIRTIRFNGLIYYYDAESPDGSISTNSIIDGLEWMAEKNITRVNISLSSTFRSSDLEEWLKLHPDITIYASYNNVLNTGADFPAMYPGVHASGCDGRIPYKDIDVSYSTNRILILNDGISFYQGNTYLSAVTMIKETGVYSWLEC